MKIKISYRTVALLVLFALFFVEFALFAEDVGLFQRLRQKAIQKFDQIKNPDWLLPQLGGRAISYVAGKAGGGIGAAIGGILGLCLGGPAAGAIGAFLGYRIGNVVTKVFVKPVAIEYTQHKLRRESFSWKNAFKSLDKKALTADSIGAVLGDLVGGAIGAAAGVALLAGCGPIAIPIIGLVAGVVIGKKLGTMIGRSAGKFILRRATAFGYEALSGNSSEKETSVTDPIDFKNVSDRQIELQQRYENAYREYVSSQIDPGISDKQKRDLLNKYQDAAFDLRALESGISR